MFFVSLRVFKETRFFEEPVLERVFFFFRPRSTVSLVRVKLPTLKWYNWYFSRRTWKQIFVKNSQMKMSILLSFLFFLLFRKWIQWILFQLRIDNTSILKAKYYHFYLKHFLGKTLSKGKVIKTASKVSFHIIRL